jgi:Predicted UDP-glucose 6-dehydrogenase
VRKGIGSDARIGSKFLYPGCGYGGSCFPKDIKSLIKTAEEYGYEMKVLKAVEAVNDKQKLVLFNKLSEHFDGDLKGKKIGLWGLAFKPETDDMREATSLILIDNILNSGGTVTAYDPVAMEEAKNRLQGKIEYATDIYDAANEADAVIVVTEWKEFRLPSWKAVKKLMKTPVVLDGRNIYDKADMIEQGFHYYSIGR